MFNMLFQAQAKYRSCGYLQHTFKLFVACKSFPKVISNVLYYVTLCYLEFNLINSPELYCDFFREFIILVFSFYQLAFTMFWIIWNI